MSNAYQKRKASMILISPDHLSELPACALIFGRNVGKEYQTLANVYVGHSYVGAKRLLDTSAGKVDYDLVCENETGGLFDGLSFDQIHEIAEDEIRRYLDNGRSVEYIHPGQAGELTAEEIDEQWAEIFNAHVDSLSPIETVYVEIEKPVIREIEKHVDRPVYVEVEKPVVQVVERIVEIPVVQIVEKPVQVIKTVTVEKPVVKTVIKTVEKPVEKVVVQVVEKPVEVIKIQTVEKPVIVEKVKTEKVYVNVPDTVQHVPKKAKKSDWQLIKEFLLCLIWPENVYRFNN